MSHISKKCSPSSAVAALMVLVLMAVAGSAMAVTLQQIKDRGYVRIAVANEIPYGYVGVDGKAAGAGPDVAKAVLKSMGIDSIQWTVTPFGSLIPALKANRVDMVSAEMAILPQRCQQIDYAGPNTTAGEGLLVLEGNPEDVHSYEIFAKRDDLKVGILSGGDQLNMMQDLGVPMSQMVMIKNNADAVAAVATGRVDAFAATGQAVAHLASKRDNLQVVQDFRDPVVHGEEIRSYDGFAFNEASDSFRVAFAKALKEFKQTDEWAEILHGYGFSETDTKMSFTQTVKQLCGDAYDAPEG